jgi:hypothetical protein
MTGLVDPLWSSIRKEREWSAVSYKHNVLMSLNAPMKQVEKQLPAYIITENKAVL